MLWEIQRYSRVIFTSSFEIKKNALTSTILEATLRGLDPSKGGLSIKMWYNTQPRDHTSAFSVYRSCNDAHGVVLYKKYEKVSCLPEKYAIYIQPKH
jgi:hypothetical protein